MNRIRRLAAILLSPPPELEETGAVLEAAGVPVSFADCRSCPNPCEEGHEEYPQKIMSMIDTTSDMLGSVKPYRRQVVISTGKSDWERSVTDVADSLAAHLLTVEESSATCSSLTPGTSTPGTPESTLHELDSTAVTGIFKDSETRKVSILNGSHDTLSVRSDIETALVFPDYKVVTEVPRSLEGARALWENSVDPSVSRVGSSSRSQVKSWVIPYSCVILICSHRRRDSLSYPSPALCRNADSYALPALRPPAFSEALQREDWEVHTQLENPTGPSLEEFNESEEEKEAEMHRRLQELDDDLPKKALVLKTSHIGGHKYAGNVIIYIPQGAGVWYGRVSTHAVNSIVQNTILGGRILPPLLRGGVNLSRPDCKRLNDW
ncbi:hypothetical protein EW146_g5082 [Bondarzewia mesenterica]|uniref:Uncharacterized protein n=1 Tax=Bondarzewia mesenterica TaxID=1095465 RepID=A0A4S4LSJ1_9AGAM|nr:hypothetical protein EW146_g5082 [Bondarzewia mesenterica]